MRGISFEVARVTLEFLTPVRVGAGGWDPLVDALFATDANGLPAIPGTSIAGVLRHAAAAVWANDQVDALFGFQSGSRGGSSQVEVSWAQIHGSDDRPVPMLGASEDALTAALAAGQVRDHVRLNARGSVDGRGKHDELVVPAGARFTFELVVHAGAGRTARELVSLLASPTVRLGAGGRKGLGRFRVIRVRGRPFDLRKSEDRSDWAKVPRGLDRPDLLPVWPDRDLASARKPEGWTFHRLVLEPLDYWMIGRGDPWRKEHHDEARVIDTVPVEARRVIWKATPQGWRGEMSDLEPLVPGSSLKGALRHRVAFHARRLTKAFHPPEIGLTESEEEVAAVKELFGTVKDDGDGHPGRILLTDGVVRNPTWGRLDHVSLDRFTQGPMDHLLFSEAPLYRGEIEFELAIRVRELSDTARQALRAALEDLTRGRLAIGAGSSRGHGYCAGRMEPAFEGRT